MKRLYVGETDDGLTKIGILVHPEQRIKEVSREIRRRASLVWISCCSDTGHHFSAMAEIEREAWEQLLPYHYAGEWFKTPASVAIKAVEQALVSVMNVRTQSRDRPRHRFFIEKSATKLARKLRGIPFPGSTQKLTAKVSKDLIADLVCFQQDTGRTTEEAVAWLLRSALAQFSPPSSNLFGGDAP